MARFGVDENSLNAGRVDAAFQRLMDFQIARARHLYREAGPGIDDLRGPSARLTVRVMAHLYEGILDAIEARSADVFTSRAHVPWPGKLRRLAECLGPGVPRPRGERS